MAKLKSQSQKYVELKEEDYLLLIENTIKMEALKIAGIEKMPIYNNTPHKQNQCLSVPNDSI